jgi:ATP-dependent Clp protease ATP-binding subunit ClpC
MGVTKQAAQKRFVPRMQDEPRGADARMFERFTERARRAITLAQDEARSLKNEHIDSEHVLLGLMAEGHGLAALALQAQDVTLERLRDAVAAAGAPTVAEPPRQIPFAPRAKKLLQLGVREALQLGHNYVGTEHLLLAVFTDDGGIGAAVLAEAGVTEAATRDWLAAEFDKYLGRT